MQLGAISSLNSTSFKRNYSFDSENPQIIDVPIDDIEDKAQYFEKQAEKIQQNVRPTTIAAGAAIAYGAFKKGKDVVPVLRNFGAKAGQYIAIAAAKIASIITGLFAKITKKENPINIDKVKENVTGHINQFIENGKANKVDGSVEKIKQFIDNIFGEEKGKGEAIKKFLEKNGITNKARIADALAAMGIGLVATDAGSDVLENAQDKAELQALARELFA